MDRPRPVDLPVVCLIAWSRILVGVLLANVIRTDVFVLSLTRNVLFFLSFLFLLLVPGVCPGGELYAFFCFDFIMYL